MPTHRATLDANYDLGYGLNLNLSLAYVADQFFYSRTTPQIRRHLDNYGLVNLRLNYVLPGKHVTAYVGADNVTDTSYAESYGLPQAGRFLYGGVRVQF